MQSDVSLVKSENDFSDILQRMSKGEAGAVTECFDKYGKLIWGIARKFTNTREDAEDAVQEVFIDLWKYADRFDAAKSPEGAFITLITRRRLIDRVRKSNVQPQTIVFETAMENYPSDAHKKLQTYVEMKYAVEALDKLSLNEKQIMKMAIYGGMTHTEIAKTVGLPLGTVKSQLRRGFQKIRKSFELPMMPISLHSGF